MSGYVDTDSPAHVMEALLAIHREIAERQNLYERVTRNWHRAERDIKKAWATALLTSTRSTVAEKKAEADIAAGLCEGAEYEIEYVAQKAVMSMLEKQIVILTSVLKAQGRI